MKLMKRSVLLLVIALVFHVWFIGASQETEGQIILPRAIAGDGIYEHSIRLIIDGDLVEEQSPRDATQTVYWDDEETIFTVDYYGLYEILGVTVQVDDNDDYRIEYSEDAVEFFPLLIFYVGYGETGLGIDTMSSMSGDPDFINVPEFRPVLARYLRISASGGDGLYAVSELQAVGVEVPAEESEDDNVVIDLTKVEGFGDFYNRVGLIIDNSIPPEEGNWNGDKCVYWENFDTFFVVDLGSVIEVSGIVTQVESDDDYRIDYSLDNLEFFPLLDIISDYGEVNSGMDTISSIPGDLEYINDLDFFPVEAQYIKIYATDGDGSFSISELQVFRKIK